MDSELGGIDSLILRTFESWRDLLSAITVDPATKPDARAVITSWPRWEERVLETATERDSMVDGIVNVEL